MVDVLRPGEPPLGSLASEEQKWLANAFTHLNRIYEKREAGSPGKNAFCVFEIGKVYVQFLARWDAEELVCEAVTCLFDLISGSDRHRRRLFIVVKSTSFLGKETRLLQSVGSYGSRSHGPFGLFLRCRTKQSARQGDVSSAVAAQTPNLVTPPYGAINYLQSIVVAVWPTNYG